MSIIVRASARSSGIVDPTVYPVKEKVGEDLLQRWIVELLRPLIERWLHHRGVRALVGADQFIYYRQHASTARVAPDIYVLPGVRPATRVTAWKTWEQGIVPSFALEIASKDWEKDYVEAPARYREAGVGELIIFDPAPDRHAGRVTWQVFRRVGGRPLARVDTSRGDRVRARALACHLRAVGTGDAVRLRLATGARGDDFFPTAEETERAAKETERAAKETERAAKEIALQRIAALEAQLRRRRPRSR